MLSSQSMTGKIFINYRRDDSIGTAGRLHDRLVQTFGRKNLFMDVDNIPAGVDFVSHLNTQVGGCDIFLAIIGPNWLNAKDDGRRRLDNPDDFVLVEIAAALARNIYVIPVLVDGALIPTADELPDSIKPLARRNAVEVRNTQFGRDAEALIDKVSEALKGPRPVTGLGPFLASAGARLMGPSHWRSVAKSATPLLLVGWIGYQMGVPVWAVWTPRTEGPDAASTEQAKAVDDAEPRRKTDEAERQHLAALRAEEERKAKAAAEAEAKRKSEEAERQRLATLSAEEERKAKAAAEAEAKRKSEEAERQRLATLRAEEERRKQAEAERLAHQSYSELNDGDYNRAIATAGEAMRLDPKSTLAFLNRGVAYMRKGDNDRAIADFNEAIRLDPKSVRALNNRASAYAQKNELDRAIADLNEAIRINPNNTMVFNNRGNAYMRKGDNDRAIADFNEEIRLDPKSARAFNNRGFAYMRKGDNNRAISDYSEAIRLNPNYARAFCNRGIAKRKIKEGSGQADVAKARQLDASICQ
jgi:tetratricopeptide (TPR) repeat protein